MSKMLMIAMWIALMYYNAADLYHTKMAFDLGIPEWNPFLSGMSYNGIVMVKAVMLFVLGLAISVYK